MAREEVIETVYGKYSKYEIIRRTAGYLAPSIHVNRDGKYWGSYSSVSDAVEAAKKAG